MSGVVDQIVFAWAEPNLFGRKGFGPVATSLGQASLDNGELTRWDYWLAERADVSGSKGERPPRSLCYWADGGNAALLYRMPAPAGSSGGRLGMRTRALVGASCDLTPQRALALHDQFWPGAETDAGGAWEAKGFDLRRVPLAELELTMRASADHLGRAAQQYPEELSRLVAAALRPPSRPCSVVGARADDTYALLWGMLDVLGKVLDGQWTFSTYETSHHGETLPRVVFLPHWPPAGYVAVNRARVDLAAASIPEDEYTKAADVLVDCYVSKGADGVDDELGRAGVDSSQGPVTRVQRILTRSSDRESAKPVDTQEHVQEDQLGQPVWRHEVDDLLNYLHRGDWHGLRNALAPLSPAYDWEPEARAELRKGLADEPAWQLVGDLRALAFGGATEPEPVPRESQPQEAQEPPADKRATGPLSGIVDGEWWKNASVAGYQIWPLVVVMFWVVVVAVLAFLGGSNP
jgi:hypothetical protein